MPDVHHVQLSVRGEAERTVAPDHAAMSCGISVVADTKEGARTDVRSAQTAMTGSLAELGGQPLAIDTARAPLTWSARSVQLHPDFDDHKGPTGRYRATLHVLVSVRDFALLGRVESSLGQLEHLELHGVRWLVDSDNPAWAVVRADAIRAALAKGGDYAAALGGSVTAVEHVADAGLLGGPAEHFERHAVALAMSGGHGDDSSLDPVPQVVSAVIEARLTAGIPPI